MKENTNIFNVEVKELTREGIKKTKDVEIYNLDGTPSLKDWGSKYIKETGRLVETIPSLTQRSAFNPGTQIRPMREDALGVLVSDGNVVGSSARQVYFLNLRPHSNNGTITITPGNFTECVVSFAARKLSARQTTWVMDKIPYLQPNEEHKDFDEFALDATIFSFFHSDTNFISHSSYGNENIELKNNFFFLSNEQMKDIADETSNVEMYAHANRDSKDRFGYKLLSELKNTGSLSKEALELLEAAETLAIESAKLKVAYSKNHIEKELNRWDAGWLQLMTIAKEEAFSNPEFKTMLNIFESAMKKLVEKMSPKVVELGFLRNLD